MSNHIIITLQDDKEHVLDFFSRGDLLNQLNDCTSTAKTGHQKNCAVFITRNNFKAVAELYVYHVFRIDDIKTIQVIVDYFLL